MCVSVQIMWYPTKQEEVREKYAETAAFLRDTCRQRGDEDGAEKYQKQLEQVLAMPIDSFSMQSPQQIADFAEKHGPSNEEDRYIYTV